MQFNKASKKTRNIADETQGSAPETSAVTDMTANPRTSRSSKTKKTETADTASGKHHHKGTSATTADGGTDKSAVMTLAAAAGAAPGSATNVEVPVAVTEVEPALVAGIEPTVTRQVTHQDVAHLAYTYWIARGYGDGGAEQDWLRAERELTTSSR